MIELFTGLVVGFLLAWLLIWDQADKRRHQHFMEFMASQPDSSSERPRKWSDVRTRLDEGLTARNNNGPGPTTPKPDIMSTGQWNHGVIYIRGKQIDYAGTIRPEVLHALATAWGYVRKEQGQSHD